MFRRLFGKAAPKYRDGSFITVDPSDRIYAVGDIHGRSDLLNGMLEAIITDIGTQSDARRSRVIFLGDYIDRGDDSKGVLDKLVDIFGIREKLERQTGTRFDFLAGNHEVAMLKFLEDPVGGKEWLEWGGKQTLASYGIVTPTNRPSDLNLDTMRCQLSDQIGQHLPFLRSLSRTVVSGRVVFVHAGLDPSFSPLDQPESAALWGVNPSGEASGLAGYRMVHGHYADYEPVTTSERVCVDTGAYFSGRLTALRLDDGEAFLHVDAADLLE